VTDRSSSAALSRRAVDDALTVQRAVDDAVDDHSPRRPAEHLPRVLHEAPAACLLLDVETGCVVQSNLAGRALADLPLPAAAAEWNAAARVLRRDGTEFPEGGSPLVRAAAGQPVTGEPVLVPGDRVLWATGFPVPSDDGRVQSLVVFFEVDLQSAGATALELRDRAVVAAGLSFTITDPRQPDDPLVFVNPAFERATGYSREEAQGRNCRFLQGPDTDPAAVQRVRELLQEQEHGTVLLLNYRKDGTAFWNELSLSPVYDGAGELTHFVGIQADVTARVLAERERERHLAAEQRARADAEHAQRRLALLAEATSMLAATLDVDESLDRLTRLVVPLMADWCTVHLMAADGSVQRVASIHRDPDKEPLLRRLEELQPAGLGESTRTSRVLRGGVGELVTQVDEQVLAGIEDEELRSIYRELAVGSSIVVPLRARRQVLGALALHTDGSGRRYDEEDLATAADLARRAALTVDNARLYQREHDVAEALQRSLLPQLPEVPGLDIAARYLPGAEAAQVGGDWYDLFRLPDGDVGLAVGDVMGHDLTAAAAMGQLRSVLQSYAWQGSGPAVVLDRLDQLVQGLDMAQLATCIYGRLRLPAGDGSSGVLRLANAGHLPPVLRTGTGEVRVVQHGVSLLVGAALGTDRDEVELEVDPGAVLVLYTDGLVEHRGRDLDVGLAALEQAVAEAPATSAQAVLDHVLQELAQGELDDDVAVLVVRVLP
jgi:PAS domain S-box-containing protein